MSQRRYVSEKVCLREGMSQRRYVSEKVCLREGMSQRRYVSEKHVSKKMFSEQDLATFCNMLLPIHYFSSGGGVVITYRQLRTSLLEQNEVRD